MNVKEAVKKAKDYLADLLSGENIAALTLEEVWLDEPGAQWCITLGVHRLLSHNLAVPLPANPDYKVIRISDSDGRVLSMRNRPSEAA